MPLNNLLDYHWDTFVGRRQPPLRGFLVYDGLINWLRKKYASDFSNMFLFFSEKSKNEITTDSFVNVDLKMKLLKLISDDINKDTKIISSDITQFEVDTKNLLKLSKKLFSLKNPNNLEASFEDFCRIWQRFAPSLLFIIFLEEACEKEIEKNSKSSSACNKIISLLIKFRNWRKNIYEDCWYNLSKKFFEDLGLYTGLNEKIEWASPDIIKKSLKERQNLLFNDNALVFYDSKNHKLTINYGTFVSDLKEKIFSNLVKDEIKGKSVCGGIVRGIALIIKPHAKDAAIKDGEIVVSKMITPDLITTIKKASAIITDEGGVTSHAAVIAREFNIPCIVGTKIATKILKTGDFVEVDADKGIVKKITTQINLKKIY